MSCVIKRPELREALVGNELFIYSESGEELLVLNRTALFVWSLCDDHDDDEMMTVLEELFPEAGRTRLAEDVRQSLDLFVREGLVETRPA